MAKVIQWLLLSLVFSIVVEWIGMLLWWPEEGVHGELILKPLREADRSLGSDYANGSLSTLFAVWECFQLFQPAYHRRVIYGCDDG